MSNPDNMYIGRPYLEVSDELAHANVSFRRYRVDGIYTILTRDVNLDRLNFDVYHDIIIGVNRG